MVRVKTVVVRSTTPNFRTAAFLIPIATAVNAMIAYAEAGAADGPSVRNSRLRKYGLTPQKNWQA